MQVDSLDTEKLWDVHITVSEGMEVYGGTIIAEVPETESIVHKSMVPPNIHGVVNPLFLTENTIYSNYCRPDFRRRL